MFVIKCMFRVFVLPFMFLLWENYGKMLEMCTDMLDLPMWRTGFFTVLHLKQSS